MFKKLGILFAISPVLIASNEYKLIELVPSSSAIVVTQNKSKSVKIPIQKRRSPMDALSGRNIQTTVMVPVNNRSVIKRKPLDALRGNPRRQSTAHATNNRPTKEVSVSKPPVKIVKIIKYKTRPKAKKSAKHTVRKIAMLSRPTIKKQITVIKKSKIHKHNRNTRTRAAMKPTGSKIMYLTFDDGPLNGTANVLAATKEEGIRATMFFVGEHIRHNTILFNKALSMPHVQISNHTFSHANDRYEEFYNNKNLVIRDIDKAQKLIGGPKYLRLCGRNVWRLPSVVRDDFAIRYKQRQREIADYDELKERGYQIYGWDIEWEFDHATKLPLLSAEEMADKVEVRYNRGYTAKRGKMILLAHDYMFKGIEGKYRLKEFISILKAKGWQFATIGDYSRQTPDIFVKLQKKQIIEHASKQKDSRKIQFPKEQIKVSKSNIAGKFPVQSKKTMLASKLNDAIIEFRPSKVRKLIRSGADVNAMDQSGHISLNTAVRVNNITIVKILVRQGALVNNRDAKGASPILMAKRYNRLAIGSYLINQLNVQSNESRIALQDKVATVTK